MTLEIKSKLINNFIITFSLINNSHRNSHLELQHWNLPPKYIEIFEKTIDINKEIQIKCK